MLKALFVASQSINNTRLQLHQLVGLRFSLGLASLILCSLVQAGSYALIIGIGDYAPVGISSDGDLPDIRTDLENARNMASHMGVPTGNMRILSDALATRSNIESEMDRLASLASSNDQVFIYFSGHGIRQNHPHQPNACQASLVTVGAHNLSSLTAPANLLDETNFRQRISAIATRANKVVVFLDACFSGGMRVRSLQGKGESTLIPRTLPNAPDCSHAVNNDSGVAIRALGALSNTYKNVVIISAAQANEVAWSQKGKGGGFATTAWSACLTSRKADRNGSGALIAAELQSCAQQKLNQWQQNTPEKLQHIALSGNRSIQMVFLDQPENTSAPVVTASPLAVLEELQAASSPTWQVGLSADKDRYRINQETIRLTASSSTTGYLYLLQAGTDNQSLCLLYPNTAAQDNRIFSGRKQVLPAGNHWQIQPYGPAGTDHLLAIVISEKAHLENANLIKAGPFGCMQSNQQALARLQRLLTGNREGRLSYGAASLKIREY
jgi:hypothetical protein